MSDKNNILFVVTGSVTQGDLRALRKAGVLVCEIQRMEDARLVTPVGMEQPVDWLQCALDAMAKTNYNAHAEFIKLVAQRYGNKVTEPPK